MILLVYSSASKTHRLSNMTQSLKHLAMKWTMTSLLETTMTINTVVLSSWSPVQVTIEVLLLLILLQERVSIDAIVSSLPRRLLLPQPPPIHVTFMVLVVVTIPRLPRKKTRVSLTLMPSSCCHRNRAMGSIKPNPPPRRLSTTSFTVVYILDCEKVGLRL